MSRSISALAPHHAAMLLTSLMYAANYSIAKILMPTPVSPYALVLVRLLCASLILFSIMHLIKSRLPDWRKDGLLFLWCAITGVVVNMLLFFKGLSLSMALDAAIIMTLTPPVTYIIATVSGDDSLSIRKVAGVALAFSGVYCLITKFNLRLPEFNLGNTLLLINAIAYAFYIPGVKQLGKKYDSITICAWTFLIGLPIVAIFGAADLLSVDWSSMSRNHWLALTFVIVGVTVLTYIFISFSSKKLSSTSVSFYSYLQPVFAVFIAAFLYGETLTTIHLYSGALVLAGLGLLNFSHNKE